VRSFDPSLLLALPVFLLSVIVHETAHGLVALWRGDPTARERGRLTLNPLPHVDLVGSILLPALLLATRAPFLFGWAKPVPVDAGRLRDPRNDPVRVALAGPAANALLALAFAGLARVLPAGGGQGSLQGFVAPLRTMALAGVVWNCALGLFNLIPIPPLDGSWVLMRFLRLRHIVALHQFRLLGLALVVVLMSSRTTSQVIFYTPLRLAVSACLGLFGLPVAGVL
jgi:Zn-dependent protease